MLIRLIIVFSFLALSACEPTEVGSTSLSVPTEVDPRVDNGDGCINDSEGISERSKRRDGPLECEHSDGGNGRGLSVIEKVITAACTVIVDCHGVEQVTCFEYAMLLDNIDNEIGIKKGTFASVGEAIDYEKEHGIRFYPLEIVKCMDDFLELKCKDKKVERAFKPDQENPFDGIDQMLPTSCHKIF